VISETTPTGAISLPKTPITPVRVVSVTDSVTGSPERALPDRFPVGIPRPAPEISETTPTGAVSLPQTPIAPVRVVSVILFGHRKRAAWGLDGLGARPLRELLPLRAVRASAR
jgi:hypothetical protein